MGGKGEGPKTACANQNWSTLQGRVGLHQQHSGPVPSSQPYLVVLALGPLDSLYSPLQEGRNEGLLHSLLLFLFGHC